MPIGSSLGITLPTQGGNTGTWGTDLNAEINKVITAVEAQVPASAIDFSADFDLNDNALTDVKAVAFTQQSSYTTLSSAYIKTDGNFYVRDGANNEIQITLSGALNTSSNGGIGNSGTDYGSNGITFDWDGTNYLAKNGSGADAYAPIICDTLLLRDGSSHDLTLDVGSMSTNYTFTFPSAVPGSTLLCQVDTSGNMSYSNTVANAVSFGSTVAATGTVTGSAFHWTAQEQLTINASSMDFTGPAANGTIPVASNGAYMTIENGAECIVPIDLPNTGVKIEEWYVQVDQSTAGTITAQLYTYDSSTNTTATSGSAQASTSTALITLSATGLSVTPSATTHAWIHVSVSTNDNFDVYQARVMHTKA